MKRSIYNNACVVETNFARRVSEQGIRVEVTLYPYFKKLQGVCPYGFIITKILVDDTKNDVTCPDEVTIHNLIVRKYIQPDSEDTFTIGGTNGETVQCHTDSDTFCVYFLINKHKMYEFRVPKNYEEAGLYKILPRAGRGLSNYVIPIDEFMNEEE